jgi:hypothetical protein
VLVDKVREYEYVLQIRGHALAAQNLGEVGGIVHFHHAARRGANYQDVTVVLVEVAAVVVRRERFQFDLKTEEERDHVQKATHVLIASRVSSKQAQKFPMSWFRVAPRRCFMKSPRRASPARTYLIINRNTAMEKKFCTCISGGVTSSDCRYLGQSV